MRDLKTIKKSCKLVGITTEEHPIYYD